MVLHTARNDVTKKCHNVIEKCHAMTFCRYKNEKKTQYQSAGYVKVKLIADPLMERLRQN